MLIKKNQALNAVNAAATNCQNLEVMFKTEDLNMFQVVLDSIAETRKYKEDAPITEEDSKIICEHVTTLISDMTKNAIKKQPAGYDKTKSPVEFVMAGADYLYALTMYKLGCPDIPALFNAPVQDKVQQSAEELHAAYVKYEMTMQNSFKEQRGKNAEDMRKGGVDQLMQKTSQKSATSREVGTLLAEYQALKERQNRHGAIWRFFHRAENERRTVLLSDMKQALTNRLGTTYKIDNADPSKLARQLANQRIAITLENALIDRVSNPDKVFLPEAKEESRQKLNKEDSFRLFDDVNPQDSEEKVEGKISANVSQDKKSEKSNLY